jgi:hypothetical protein
MSHPDTHSSHGAGAPNVPKLGSSLLMMAGILLLVILVVVGTLLLGRSGSATQDEDAERAALRSKNLAELQASDETLLASYGWVNQAKGIVHLPIARAMELVLPTLNAKPAPTPLAVLLPSAPALASPSTNSSTAPATNAVTTIKKQP